MRPELMALYGAPNQILGLPSVFATLAGLALMFWNKLVGLFGKIANKVRPSDPAERTSQKATNDES